MYTFTYPRELYNELALDKIMILKLILKHQFYADKLRQNKRYYMGEHSIKNRTRTKDDAPNHKIVCNHAKDITDTADGYFMGNPVTYKSDDEKSLETLTDALKESESDECDSDLSLDMSIYGLAYEYIYAKENDTVLKSKCLDATQTFIVHDDSIEENELFAVYYYYKKNDVDDTGVFIATVITENYKYVLHILNDEYIEQNVSEEPVPHFLGGLSVIEYRNNKECIGDFEQQISLIDAYNILMSDRLNDKEQFIDALLVLYGSQLGDDEEETAEAIDILKESKLLELPLDAKAEYLTRTFEEDKIETLRKALKEDIYTFSHVPNLTDENFIGNSSGVALEYKLLGLEMITKVKEKYFKKGIRKRVELFCNYLGLKQTLIDKNSIIPVFTRCLPKDLLNLAQIISNLGGVVSQRTLLSLLPFIENPDEELEATEEENQKKLEQQQALFEQNANTPISEEDEIENDKEEDSKSKKTNSMQKK